MNNKINDEEEVGSNFLDVAEYIIEDNTIDLLKLSKLEGRFGSNGGVGCDVLVGPCSCGAWH